MLMAVNFIHGICFTIIVFCIGHGDGRWRTKDKEKLHRDIDVFNKMAEKIEREIEEFYGDYPGEQIKGDDIENIHQQYIKNVLKHKTVVEKLLDKNETKTVNKLSFESNKTRENPANLKAQDTSILDYDRVKFKNNEPLNVSNFNWPKFDDILLEIGKRYDWKNDRWIKVKRKLKRPLKKIVEVDNDITFHEKHKFSYRTIKLNRKSRRNVVIAVTAVR